MTLQFPNIEAERARLGLSKEEFSQKLNITTKTYYNWIGGESPIPSTYLIKLSNLCDSDTDYLLGLKSERR